MLKAKIKKIETNKKVRKEVKIKSQIQNYKVPKVIKVLKVVNKLFR